ncbi:MAG: GDP-mannose 4,6-dehydratase, partial [Pseudomonadota bacterium]|nr:GDP-mannose 4,6-dehydratase [Pseudomonadota bacterium]
LPNSPYAASKAASDLMVRAYNETFGLPVVTTRCSNNYGPYQFPEKLIPLMLTRALHDQPLPVYGDGNNVRDWIYVTDHCDGIWQSLTKGKLGAVYNLGGECELSNLEVVNTLLDAVGKPTSLIQFVTDRPGHDRRYAMDVALARKELDWRPMTTFKQGIEATVEWYLANRDWWINLLPETQKLTAKLYGGN